jgi:tetratricopeptide (TPR) repeat protein
MSAAALVALAFATAAWAAPYTPLDDAQVLVTLPAGSRYTNDNVRAIERRRIDVAVPLARLQIERARATADLRYLGYAEATLSAWLRLPQAPTDVLVLQATILQSRHQFDAALQQLDRALAQSPDNAQAWLTRAIILRVLGRYEAARASCLKLPTDSVEASATANLCEQSLLGLGGRLRPAYENVVAIGGRLSPALRAWRCSELGEMAQRLGDDAAAERWLLEGLREAPDDFYMRAAYADLLLRQLREAEVPALLAGREAIEPLLLRMAIAQRRLGLPAAAPSASRLAESFAIELRRHEGVHLREQARYYLDVDVQPQLALRAALQNWHVQKEPEDLLILQRAAIAAGKPGESNTALDFMREQGIEDRRLPLRGAANS